MTPPLRFVVAVVSGWGCLRAAFLFPGGEDAVPAAAPTAPVAERKAVAEPRAPFAALPGAPSPVRVPALAVRSARPQRHQPTTVEFTPLSLPAAKALPAEVPRPREPQPPSLFAPSNHLEAPSRWSLTAWAFARRGEAQDLASRGTLGGSQIGARISYRVRGSERAPLSLIARLYSPVRRERAAEAAVGLEWQPVADVPMRVAGERRQGLGPEGRSAFAVGVHGGIGVVPVARGFGLEAYAQAGVVGLRSRDFYVDGAARLSRPLGDRLSLGVGAWGAAQPGVSRVDIGPSVGVALPEARARLALDWRVRALGDATPGSGPAVTLSTGF